MILNYITWNPSPEIFTIPGINWPVRWYGLMWAMAFIASHFIMNRIYRKEGRTDIQLDTLTLYIILGTIIGARLGHCLFYGPWFDEYNEVGMLMNEGYLSHPLNILKVYEGGLASHGGALGIITAMILYCRKTKESWLWLFDRRPRHDWLVAGAEARGATNHRGHPGRERRGRTQGSIGQDRSGPRHCGSQEATPSKIHDPQDHRSHLSIGEALKTMGFADHRGPHVVR